MGEENPICTLGDYSKPSHEGYRNTIELPVRNNVSIFSLCYLFRNPFSSTTMGDENPIRTLRDYSKPNHEGYKNTIELPVGNNVKVPRHGIDLWLQVHIFMTMSILSQDEPLTNRPVNDPRDFAKPVKAIALPQDVPSTSDRHLIKLETQVQRLMEAHLALTQPTKVNKITTSCEICNGPHDTHYCMENLKQAFIDYASLRIDEARGKWYTFKLEKNNLGDTYNSSWRSHPNLRLRQPQNSINKFSKPPNRFQPSGSIPNHSFNNHPQNFNNQSNIEGLVSKFMASQDARLSKFEADFKQQQSEMTNKIDIVLKAITDRIAGTLPSDTKESKTRLADGTKSYPVRIVKDVEVHIGKLKLLNDFYVIDMKKDPETPLLVGRRFLATANVVIDYRMAKIAVGERITRSVFNVKGVDLGEEEAPYWNTLGKRESYKPRPRSKRVGAQTPYYARKDFLDCHLPREWEISRDYELNPFKDTLVFRGMVEFLGTIPINLKCNMWKSKDLIKNKLTGTSHPKIKMEHGMPRLD
nr:hypothetical protein [Tanacetum cinerariifolium]